MNQHLLRVWKQQDELGRNNRELLSLMRRHAWNLKPEQLTKLNHYLAQYPVLEAMYQAKQTLMRLLLMKNLRAQQARQYIAPLLELIRQSSNSPAKTMADTLHSGSSS